MAVDPIDKLSRLLADFERRLKAMERGSQLGNSSIRVNGSDVTVADSVRAAILADEKAAAAISAATDALAKADGVVNTYFTDGATPPDDPSISQGDFWYRRDTKESYQFDGTDWQPLTSTDIREALEKASAAASAVDGKISTFYSTSQPANPGVGDVWYQPPANTPRRWNGSAWQLIRDGRIQDALDAASDAKDAALTAQQSADGRTKVVYSQNDPNVNGVNQGDTWFKIDAGGLVLGQWQWSGTSWGQVTPQSATVASLDAGRITSGTIAAGVTITIGVPGGDRTEITSSAFRSYKNNALRFSTGTDGGSFVVVSDVFLSANYVNGGQSHVRIGDLGDGDTTDGIILVQPGSSNVTFKNSGSSGSGELRIGLRNNGNGIQNDYVFGTTSIASSGSFFSLRNNVGSQIGMSDYNLQMYAPYGQFGVNANSSYFSGYTHTFSLSSNSGGLQVTQPSNGAYGTTLLRNNYYGGGTIKLTSDGAVQIRDWNDYGYSYLRAIVQDQSSPTLKENITELHLDALAELSGMKYYAYDWIREPIIPFVRPPRDSSTGILLSEVPNSVQQTDTGYAIGSLLGLAIAAINQLRTRVEALEAR